MKKERINASKRIKKETPRNNKVAERGIDYIHAVIMAESYKTPVSCRTIEVEGKRITVTNTGIIHDGERIYKHHSVGVQGRYRKVNINSVGYYVHRLVHMAHRPHIDITGLDVDHVDGNPLNNHLDNLEAVTHAENIKRRDVNGGRKIAIVQYNTKGIEVARFKSMKEAAAVTGLDHGNICRCANGEARYSHVGGYSFRKEVK